MGTFLACQKSSANNFASMCKDSPDSVVTVQMSEGGVLKPGRGGQGMAGRRSGSGIRPWTRVGHKEGLSIVQRARSRSMRCVIDKCLENNPIGGHKYFPADGGCGMRGAHRPSRGMVPIKVSGLNCQSAVSGEHRSMLPIIASSLPNMPPAWKLSAAFPPASLLFIRFFDAIIIAAILFNTKLPLSLPGCHLPAPYRRRDRQISGAVLMQDGAGVQMRVTVCDM